MRLPLVCAPRSDEPQLSWLTRLAWENRCSVVDLLEHCAIAVPGRSDLALGLTDRDLDVISQATSLPVDDLAGLGMRHTFARSGELTAVGDAIGVHRGTVFAHSHLRLEAERGCRECLRERRGAVQVRWLHRLSTCCMTHDVLLVDMFSDRARRIRRPPLTSLARPPGAPGNQPTQGLGPLGGPEHVSLDWRDLGLAATIEGILAGQPAEFKGRQITPAETSRFLWCVVLLLARFIGPEDIPLDRPRREALEAFAARRPSTRNQSAEPGTVLRRDYASLAALAPSAWALTLGDDQPFRDDLLNKLIGRINAPQNRCAHVRSYNARLPDWLRIDIEGRTTAYRFRFSSRRLERAGVAVHGAQPAHTILPSQIPQMLWPRVYKEAFAPLLPNLTTESGRTLCSILLLRVGPCSNLKSAARLLGQRGAPSVGALHYLVALTDGSPLRGSLGHRLRTLSAQLATMDLPTDYAALRTKYEHCEVLKVRDASNIVAPLAAAGRLDSNAKNALLSSAGRAALALWIWTHATHSRVDKSARYNTGVDRQTVRLVATITSRHLDPHSDTLLDILEEHLGMPLREPELRPLV